MNPISEKPITVNLTEILDKNAQITVSVKVFKEMLLLKSTLEGTNLRERFFELLKKDEREQLLLIIDYIKDVNITTRKGETPLSYAAYNDDIELARLLIEKGADVNAGDSDETPLHHAAKNGRPELVELLIENGADLEAVDYAGRTPLFSAASENAALALKTLLEEGADVNFSDKWGNTALHRIKKQRLCKLLIDYGADVNARNNKGETPLHFASFKVAKCLVEYGKAKVNLRDNTGRTPMDNALKWSKNKKLILFLESHGAKIGKWAK